MPKPKSWLASHTRIPSQKEADGHFAQQVWMRIVFPNSACWPKVSRMSSEPSANAHQLSGCSTSETREQGVGTWRREKLPPLPVALLIGPGLDVAQDIFSCLTWMAQAMKHWRQARGLAANICPCGKSSRPPPQALACPCTTEFAALPSSTVCGSARTQQPRPERCGRAPWCFMGLGQPVKW